MTKTLTNKPDKVILHCSATEDYPFGVGDFDRIGYDEINSLHIAKGFNGCGYHFIVKRSGLIQSGRNPRIIGAHCKGHNTNSLGVCWVGSRYPTEQQIDSLCELYKMIKTTYDIGFFDWYPHYQFANKLCPGFSIELIRRIFRLYDRER